MACSDAVGDEEVVMLVVQHGGIRILCRCVGIILTRTPYPSCHCQSGRSMLCFCPRTEAS